MKYKNKNVLLQEENLALSVLIYKNDGFAVFKTTNGDRVVGKFIDEPKNLIGKTIKFFGQWIEDKKYGRTFSFQGYETQKLDIYYFLTSVVGGIGSTMADAIIEKFKEKTEDIIENSPHELLLINGIKSKKLEDIVSSMNKYKHIKKISEKLSPLGVSNYFISKIYEKWGDEALAIVLENPYKIIEIDGFGFKKADDFSIKFGIKNTDPRRLDACLLHAIEEGMKSSGNSIISDEAAGKYFSEELDKSPNSGVFDETQYERSKNRLLSSEKIILLEKNAVTTPKMYMMESYIYETLTKANIHRTEEPTPLDFKEYIAGLSIEMGINFGEKQVKAIELISKNFSVISIAGFAGSGKTTVSRAFLRIFENKYGRDAVVCCALSGVAANKAKMKSGYEGITIHSLLGVSRDGEFIHNEKRKLPQRVIMVDESSTISIEIFYHLLKAVDLSTTVLIFLGDPAQLPPIGCGNVFSDILECEMMPSVTLDKVFRQSEDQAITTIANQVRIGDVPDVKVLNFKDFKFVDKTVAMYREKRNSLSEEDFIKVKEDNNQDILELIRRSGEKIEKYIKDEKLLEDKLMFFQVLAPMKTGTLGVDNLNKVLQVALNPDFGGPSIAARKIIFRENDKIIHLKNRQMQVIPHSLLSGYMRHKDEDLLVETRVFNGQIGSIMEIDDENGTMYVNYPFERYVAIYEKKDLLQNGDTHVVNLAYAMSIHKAQGSEFKNVLMPITMAHTRMLSPNLIYTGITRAKEKMVLIGDINAFNFACKSDNRHVRTTLIKDIFEKERGLLNREKGIFKEQERNIKRAM